MAVRPGGHGRREVDVEGEEIKSFQRETVQVVAAVVDEGPPVVDGVPDRDLLLEGDVLHRDHP